MSNKKSNENGKEDKVKTPYKDKNKDTTPESARVVFTDEIGKINND